MKLYGGIDLHSNNNYLAIIDEADRTLYHKRLSNNLEHLLSELSIYRESLEGVVVESTYNWYWLVDGLQEAGFSIHLANTSALEPYKGLKYTDDKTDAIWLAKLLRLNLLAKGYIYPKEQRGVRELLRKRMTLVSQQTQAILGIQSQITRYRGIRISSNNLKKITEEKLSEYLNNDSGYIAAVGQLRVLKCLMNEIGMLEAEILSKLKEDKKYQLLRTVPGIGKILSMVILLETGEISRFKDQRHYSSYCRCVESKRISNGKKKGENNRKNGNRYLGWAFMEAACFAIRHYPEIKRCYQRKLNRAHQVVALKTIAHKLAQACFFILRDEVEFDMNKQFN